MKQLFFFIAIFSLSLIFNSVNAQKCKPDYSKVDKIENKKIDAWSSELYETPLMKAALTTTSSISITFSIGRMDTLNFVQLTLRKEEENVGRAILESSLKGANGNEFYFGMKDSDPLKFVTSEASNETKANMFGKIITTVTLGSEITSENLQKIKEALTGNNIIAVRIKLENGLTIDQNIKNKNSNKTKDKAVCFFNFLDEQAK
jgi:hypothetical protein